MCIRDRVQGLWRIQEELERTRSAEKDEAFHDAIIDLGGDPLMRIVSDALSDVIGHLITQFLTRGAQDLLHQTLDTHRRMIEYLEQRRVDAGCAAITRHYDIIDTEIDVYKRQTYTVLKRLCERGLFQTQDSVVTPLLSRTEFYARQSEQFVEQSFDGSLPAFLAALDVYKRQVHQRSAAQ